MLKQKYNDTDKIGNTTFRTFCPKIQYCIFGHTCNI